MKAIANVLDAGSTIAATVLAIDDAPLMLKLIEDGLSNEYTVYTARSGAEGLQLCARYLPDLVLLDVDMPVMDGYEVCRKLKADPALQHIPVIFLTGHDDPSFEARAFNQGAADYLAKPLQLQTVKVRINSQIRLSRAIKELQMFNDLLEDRVAQRTLDLQRALADLSATQADLLRWQAKATLMTLVTSVSHDLGSPIGNALMASSTIQTRLARCKAIVEASSEPNADLIKHFDVAVRNAQLVENNLERAGSLLSNFHRVATDQVSEVRRCFELRLVVNETINSLAPSLHKHEHRVDIEIAPDISMESYPGALSRVLINLVNNAVIHAFPQGTAGRVLVKAKRWGEYVEIEVSDDGIGMGADELKRIFDPFYTSRGDTGSTGLGLAIAKGQVDEVLKGTMTVVSQVGVGTKFRMLLPRVVHQGEPVRANATPLE